jgi:AcrR family transcriptional regulator
MDDPGELFPSEQFVAIVRNQEPYVTDNRDDRRVQRSKQDLYSALISLIREKRFDKITVQEIIDRANVGRTTFYSHFQSKEDLFLSSHEEIIRVISRSFFSEAGTLRAEVSPELLAFLEMTEHSRDVYFYLTGGSDTAETLRLIKERVAEQLAARLHELFREEDSAIPFVVLAQYVAGSMVSLFSWWLGKRTPYSALEIATMLHQMNQGVLRQALESGR